VSKISKVERWAELAARVPLVEEMPYGDEQKSALKDVADDIRQYLVELESDSLDVRLEALTAICASPYFYLALDVVRPPSSVAYTLISKGLYDLGVCKMPQEFVADVEFLTDGLEDSEVPGGVGRHRRSVLSNPDIDPEILEDEFDTTDGGDLDIVDAVLANPNSPIRLLHRLFEGQFDSGDWDGFDLLDQLLKHPALPREILESVASERYDWEVEDELRQELSDKARSKLA
jgi:hypothetical protein